MADFLSEPAGGTGRTLGHCGVGRLRRRCGDCQEKRTADSRPVGQTYASDPWFGSVRGTPAAARGEITVVPLPLQLDAAGQNLRGLDFSARDLTRANLEGADLSEARFVNANLTRANLRRASLVAADLTAAKLADCRNCCGQRGPCECSAPDLLGADLAGGSWRRARLVGASWIADGLRGDTWAGPARRDSAAHLGLPPPRCEFRRTQPRRRTPGQRSWGWFRAAVGGGDGPGAAPVHGTRERGLERRLQPGRQRLATGSDDRTVRLWEVATGQELALRGA